MADVEVEIATKGAHRRDDFAVESERLKDFGELVGFLVAGGKRDSGDAVWLLGTDPSGMGDGSGDLLCARCV